MKGRFSVVWTEIGSLKGPQGAPGADSTVPGPKGDPGDPGEPDYTLVESMIGEVVGDIDAALTVIVEGR